MLRPWVANSSVTTAITGRSCSLDRDRVGDRERRARAAGAETDDREVDRVRRARRCGCGRRAPVSPTWPWVSTVATSATPSARSRSSQSAARSRHERQAASVRMPARSPATGPSTRNVGAPTAAAGGAVGFRMTMVSGMGPAYIIHASAYKWFRDDSGPLIPGAREDRAATPLASLRPRGTRGAPPLAGRDCAAAAARRRRQSASQQRGAGAGGRSTG